MTQPEFWIERQPPCPAIVFNTSQSLPEEIARFDSKGFYYKGDFIDDAGEVHRLLKQVLEGQLNLATPPPEPLRPIPVSERLPRAEDCSGRPTEKSDAGWCWCYAYESWSFSPVLFPMPHPDQPRVLLNRGTTHWLPSNALPLPEVTQ